MVAPTVNILMRTRQKDVLFVLERCVPYGNVMHTPCVRDADLWPVMHEERVKGNTSHHCDEGATSQRSASLAEGKHH